MKNISYFFLQLSVKFVLFLFVAFYPALKFYKIH
jgi:hypothetical protein